MILEAIIIALAIGWAGDRVARAIELVDEEIISGGDDDDPEPLPKPWVRTEARARECA